MLTASLEYIEELKSKNYKLSGNQGEIQSPNYPNLYDNDMHEVISP